MVSFVSVVAAEVSNACMCADLFLSGSDDGLVRQTDIREPARGGGASGSADEATSASENASIVGARWKGTALF
jgi:hypothetical protein